MVLLTVPVCKMWIEQIEMAVISARNTVIHLPILPCSVMPSAGFTTPIPLSVPEPSVNQLAEFLSNLILLSSQSFWFGKATEKALWKFTLGKQKLVGMS